jgi:hypothetical protein
MTPGLSLDSAVSLVSINYTGGRCYIAMSKPGRGGVMQTKFGVMRRGGAALTVGFLVESLHTRKIFGKLLATSFALALFAFSSSTVFAQARGPAGDPNQSDFKTPIRDAIPATTPGGQPTPHPYHYHVSICAGTHIDFRPFKLGEGKFDVAILSGNIPGSDTTAKSKGGDGSIEITSGAVGVNVQAPPAGGTTSVFTFDETKSTLGGNQKVDTGTDHFQITVHVLDPNLPPCKRPPTPPPANAGGQHRSSAVPLIPGTQDVPGYVPWAPTIPQIPGLPGTTTGQNISYNTISLATDTSHYCTFGEGTPGQIVYTPTDSSGHTVAPDPGVPMPGGGQPADTPKTPGADNTPGTTPPPSATDNNPGQPANNPPPPTATDNPPPSATTTDNTPTPTTTDNPPPALTTDDTIHVTIFIKATQEVVTGGQTGQPIGGQVVKLIFDTPNFPSTQDQKTSDDVGYDKPAPQTSTDANGQGQIVVSNDDKPTFGLTQSVTSGGKPVSHFSVSLNMLKHDGAVGELTGHTMPDLKATLVPNGNFIAEKVQIGSHTYVRIGANTPYGTIDNLIDTFSKLLGIKLVVDICIIKEPGPPLGKEPESYGALNNDLPQASVVIARIARTGAER